MSFVGSSMEETKVIYYIDDEETPYLVKLPIPPGQVTLADFKTVLNKPNYKFFFKSMDDDFGVVKEEIVEDDVKLPYLKGRVVSWLDTAEGSNVSDTTSQCTEVTSSQRAGSGQHGNNHVDNHNNFSETESVASLRRDRHSHRTARHKDKHSDDHGNMCKGPGSCGCDSRNCHYKHNHGHSGRLCNNQDFETSSMMTSDIESTSFFDSEDETTSRISTTTEETSVSKIHARNHRRRRRKHRMPLMSRTSSISSITDSTMSLNIITVTLNLDTVNFLGISIVGQSNKGGDGGIYVGSIMKGGAVAIDGRIEPGDMILQVNAINFENMSNDDAVRVLREAVQKPGPIKLVVAKCWDPNPKGYFTIPRMEPVRPIDPGAWVAHTEAARANECSLRPPSVSTLTSTSSSITSSIPESDRHFTESSLTIDTDLPTIVKAMATPESGLDVRDRMWLKITIPNAFIGADVVDWLFTHVQGFQDRRDARKLATQLLKEGYIRHTVNKITFSEQCYYVFGDLCNSVAALKVTDEDSVSEVDRDTLGPLPPPTSLSPWGNQMPYSGSYLPHAAGFIPMPFSFANDPPNYHPFEQEGSVNSGSGGSSNGVEMRKEKKKSPVGSDSEMASQRSVSALHLNGEGACVGGGSSGSESANSQIRRDTNMMAPELGVEDDIFEYRFSDKGVV